MKRILSVMQTESVNRASTMHVCGYGNYMYSREQQHNDSGNTYCTRTLWTSPEKLKFHGTKIV